MYVQRVKSVIVIGALISALVYTVVYPLSAWALFITFAYIYGALCLARFIINILLGGK